MAPRRDSLTFNTVASHLGVIVAVSAVIGVLVAGLAVPVVSALGYGTAKVADSLQNLPEELQADPLAERTRVLDADGRLIASFYDQNRSNVALEDIAPVMRKSIVAVEDARFYEHGALDLKGTLRAFLTNQAGDGSTQGGSSITQQMAKMTALNQARTKEERKAATAETYTRKIQELRHAIAFEQNYSKDWILNRYLNIAYFGSGAYGVQAAARHYFDVDAKDLDARQAALLAGLVKNPVGYDPTKYPDRAKARRHVVLDAMVKEHVVDRAEADRIDKSTLGLHVKPTPNGCVGSRAPFFCDYVRRYLLADPALGRTVDERQQLLTSGGLTIKTTMRLPFQRAAERATHAHVNATDEAVGAMAMVQPGTGKVLAVAHSRPMGRDKSKGETFLNYAVPDDYGDAAGFQPGSTFKLFTLASALEQGLPASTSIYAPSHIDIAQNEFRTCDGPYTNYADYPVNNSTDSGTMNMYSGMQLSVNTFFVQLERRTGLCMPYQLAKKLGVQLSSPDHEQVPSFTLGVTDVSPLEMAGAYATMAARGKYCAARPVTTILNSQGDVFKKYPARCSQVVSEATADTISDILRGVMEGGFGSGLQLDKPSAGKTGTTQDNKAVWFDGYTPEVATAAVVAGVNQKGHPRTLNGVSVGGSVIGTAHGSTIAGPMWADAMRAIQDRIPYKNFPPAPPATSQSGLPSVEGRSVGEAESAVRAAGFDPVLAGEMDSGVTVGFVAGASLGADGSTVYLYTSTGHGGFAPPERTGRGRDRGRNQHNGIGPGTGNGTAEGNAPGRGHGHGHGHGRGR
jgi:membrane peptidoglycan carboxypeptidase